MKKNAKISSVVALTAALAVSVSTAAAINNSSPTEDMAVNNFNPAKVDIAVVENESNPTEQTNPTLENSFTWTVSEDETDVYTVEKNVKIHNTKLTDNNTKAYIRVCIVPKWIATVKNGSESIEVEVTNTSYLKELGNLEDINIIDNSYTMGDITFTLDSDWNDYWFFNPKDGYFYYKKAVLEGSETELLLTNVSVSAEVKSETSKNNVTLDVEVLADSIQTQEEDDEQISLGGVNALNTRWKNADIEIITNSSDSSYELTTKQTTSTQNN
jgi:hypothetical protein